MKILYENLRQKIIVINKKIEWANLPLTIYLSTFKPSSGIAEYHAMVIYNNKFDIADTQFCNIEKAIERLQKEELKDTILVFKRYFLSDAINQQKYVIKQPENTATSIVEQPPLDGTKVSVWLYFTETGELSIESSGSRILEHSSYKHLYSTQLQNPLKNEGEETRHIFENYTQWLKQHGCTLKENCIRTWIYVQGVDIHYVDMVKARVDFFKKEGLTQDTHYIASTGIEGRHIDPRSLVLMDAYSIQGIDQEQIKYLYAPTHLSPTYKYGVTFERGTSVDYGDRRHIFISGTASIDKNGEIVHPTDITKQTQRTFENIEVLLKEADAGFDNIAQMIVYLRDTADYQLVSEYVEKHYSHIPYVMVWAPVCRPGWLVEVECIALKEIENNRFAKF